MNAENRGTAIGYSRELERVGPVSVRTKLFYAAGEGPGAYMNLAIGGLLLLYYNQILGANAAHVSTALGLALLLDAVSDPLVGAFSDRLKFKLGRRHPLMYVASVPMGVFISLLFSPPSELEGTMLIAWLLVFLVLTRLTFTVFSVPWSALIAELSEDYGERTVIASYRILLGSLLTAVSAFSIYTFWFAGSEQFPQGQLNPLNYEFFGPLIGVLMTSWALVSTHFTKREIPYLLVPDQKPSTSFSEIFTLIYSALRSRNYRIVLISILIFFGILGTLGQFDMYVNTYFWKLTGEQMGIIGLFTIIAPVLAFSLASPIQARFQKQHILSFVLLGQMILSMAVVLFRLGGIFPVNESAFFLPLLGGFSIAGTFLSAVGAMIIFSMIADLADEQEYTYGTRQEGVLASGIAFSTKAVSSLGVVIAGFLLQYFVGFPAGSVGGAGGQASADIDPDVLFRLVITDAVIVNSLILIPAFLIRKYSLSSDQVRNMQNELRGR